MVLQPLVDDASQHSDTTIDIDTPSTSETSLSPTEEKMLLSPPTYADSEKASSQGINKFPTQQEAEDNRRSKKIQQWITVLGNIRLLLIAVLLVLGAGYVARAFYSSHGPSQSPVGPPNGASFGKPPPPSLCSDNKNKDKEYESSASREVRIHESTHSIIGTFTLLDLVELMTHTGSVDVSVNPGSNENDKPTIARFVSVTHTGSIAARFPGLASQIPSRDYATDIHTNTGSISGSYVLGTDTQFHTNTGSISISLLPVRSNGSSSVVPKYYSRTNTAPQTITIYESDDSSAMMKKVDIRVESSTGAVTLKLPGSFEGNIKASSHTGSVNVSGKGVRVVRGTKGRVEAVKGEDGEGAVKVHSNTGKIEIVVG